MEVLVTPAGKMWNGTTVPALCLDLDGTVRRAKTGDFIKDVSDIELFPGAEQKIWEYRNAGYLILGISNQGGVAFGLHSPAEIDAELDATFALFERNPFHIAKVCYHHEQGEVFPYNKRSLLRKPNIGMLALMEVEAFNAGYLIDWDKSLFVGDRPEDEHCALNAGVTFRHADIFFAREGKK